MAPKGVVVVISGPSGSGKGTLLNVLKKNNSNIKYSISATTRTPRDGEVNGESYFFKTTEEFNKMIDNDELLEWVEYCDNFYGTPKDYVDKNINDGFDIIIEIEVEGAIKIMEKYPECVTIFVLPPTMQELKHRIEKRGSETTESINKRMNRATQELQYAKNYQYLLVNDEIDKSSILIEQIILTEKLKYKRNAELINALIKEK